MGSKEIPSDDGDKSLHEEYRLYTLKKVLFTVSLLMVVFVVGILSLTLGDYKMGFSHALNILLDHLGGATYDKSTEADLWWDDYIVWDIRLPRVLVAIVAGAGLALGGASMQVIVHNPLADPYTTGISSGAVLGISVALTMGFGLANSIGTYGMVLNAFVFALIPAGIIIVISRITNLSPATLILTGIAMSYIFNALSTLLLVSAEAETIQSAYLWQIGTLENVTWDYLPMMTFVNVIGATVMLVATKKLNLLTLGDESAKSLGLDPENFRILMLILLSIMTASVVGFIGIIGFIGLVSPHIVRMILGADNKYVVPASGLFGAAFLLVADALARIVIDPGQIPVGIIISFIGAPIFLTLIVHSKKAIW